jgi:FkbM family methyltransferase
MGERDLRFSGIDPELTRRVAMTVSCRDTDGIEKVPDAGELREQDGVRVQVMHNGLLVEEGGYYGDWMTEVIRVLRGHHEPQEELVFDQILRRLRDSSPAPVMLEIGSYWAYYSLWFCRSIANARAIALEPDVPYLEVGRRNARLNSLDDRVTFTHGAIGLQSAGTISFRAESDGLDHEVAQYSLRSLMEMHGLQTVDLILCDAQGAETPLLEGAKDSLRDGVARFLVISTHHHSISGDPLTHQKALNLLEEAGGHVITEHSVTESFSGDGLIAVSFDDRDREFTVPVSFARSKDSLFGELEYDLADMLKRHDEALASLDGAATHIRKVEAMLAASEEGRALLQHRVDTMEATKVWRWSRVPRALYASLQRHRGDSSFTS